jgi:hypothetical protein
LLLLLLFRFALAILRYGAWAHIRAEWARKHTRDGADRNKDAALNISKFSKIKFSTTRISADDLSRLHQPLSPIAIDNSSIFSRRFSNKTYDQTASMWLILCAFATPAQQAIQEYLGKKNVLFAT